MLNSKDILKELDVNGGSAQAYEKLNQIEVMVNSGEVMDADVSQILSP